MNKVELDASKIKVNTEKPEGDDKETQCFIEMMPWDAESCKERMVQINKDIKDVSHSRCSLSQLPLTGLA